MPPKKNLKLKVAVGAPPPSEFSRGNSPQASRNAFGLIQEYCTNTAMINQLKSHVKTGDTYSVEYGEQIRSL